MEDKYLRQVLRNKVQHLFITSDKEKKGFIDKKDMKSMRSEVQMSDEQLEAVFETLDSTNSGRLTLDQFVAGFVSFLPEESKMASNSDLEVGAITHPPTLCDNQQYQQLITQIGETRLLDNHELLQCLCDDVMQDGGQQTQADLEAFLKQLVESCRRLSERQAEMEVCVRNRDEKHDMQVKQLYDEMEFQLNEEKDKIELKVETRLRQMKRQMETSVMQKEDELKDVTSALTQAELQLRLIDTRESKLRQNNAQLNTEKDELTCRLDKQSQDNQRLRQAVRKQSQGSNLERKKNETTGYRLAQRIQLEEQGLLEQLHTLKSIANLLERKTREDAKTCDTLWVIG